MNYNGWNEVVKFGKVKTSTLDYIYSLFCIGRDVPRNTSDHAYSRGMTFANVCMVAAFFGIAKLLIGFPFLTVIGLGLCLGMAFWIPMMDYTNNYLNGFVFTLIGLIGYFTNFMTLKIFSFDVFPYFMLLMTATGALAVIRRYWNALNWKLCDHLYQKYNIESINESLLNEAYENKQFEDN